MKDFSDRARLKELIEQGVPVFVGASLYAHNRLTNTDDEISISPDKFTASGNSYTQNGGYNFPIGNVLSKSVKLSILNQTKEFDKYDFIGARVSLYSFIYDGGTTYRIDEGRFYISEPEVTAYKIEAVAYDMASFMDYPFSIVTAHLDGSTPGGVLDFATLWDYFVYLCDTVLAEKLGITLTSSQHLYASHLETDRFPNSTMEMPYIFASGQAPTTTLRDIFGYIAQLAGGNAVIVKGNYYDEIDIISYDLSDSLIINGGTFGDGMENVIDCGTFDDSVIGVRYRGGLFTDVNYYLLDKYGTPPTFKYGDTEYTKVLIKYPLRNSSDEGQASFSAHASPDNNVLELYNPLAQDDASASSKIIACARNIYYRVCGTPIKAFDGSFSNNPMLEFMDNVVVVDIDGKAYNSFISSHTMNYLGYSEISNNTPSKVQNSRTFLR